MLSRYDVSRPFSPLWSAPTRPLDSMLSRLFEDLDAAFGAPIEAARRAPPRVQLRDRGDSVSIVADVPGLQPSDIDLSIEGETVTLRAQAQPRAVPQDFEAIRRERQPAKLAWSFELPYPIDAAAASASLEQGRLWVTLPKAPEAKPHKIVVTTG